MLPITLAFSLATPIPFTSHGRASDFDASLAAIGDGWSSLGVTIALLVSFLLGLWSRTRHGSLISLGKSINAFAALAAVLAAIAALTASFSPTSLAVFGIVMIAAATVATPRNARRDPPRGEGMNDPAGDCPQHGAPPGEESSVAVVAAAGKAMLSDILRFLTNLTTATNTFVAEALAVHRQYVEDGDGNVREQRFLADCWPRLRCFVETRLTEALEWMEPADAPQITVWTANASTQRLHFAFSTQNVGRAVTEATFDRGEGIAGAALLDQMNRNEVHPSRLPIFKALPGVPYPFGSMLVIPIWYGALVIGVLCVDRMRAERFDPMTIEIMEALAYALGTAIGLRQWIDDQFRGS